MHVMTHARWAIVLFQLRGPTSGLSHMLRMEFGKLPYLGRMRGRNLQDNGPLADNVRLAHCAPGKPASTPAFPPLKPQSSISTLSTIPSSFPSSCDTSCAFLARETYPQPHISHILPKWTHSTNSTSQHWTPRPLLCPQPPLPTKRTTPCASLLTPILSSTMAVTASSLKTQLKSDTQKHNAHFLARSLELVYTFYPITNQTQPQPPSPQTSPPDTPIAP